MNDEEVEKLVYPEFWDQRYIHSAGDEPTHEWYRTFEDLAPFFVKLYEAYGPETNPKLLHLGSGDSTIPRDLANRGYKDQICIDFSTIVVDMMVQRHADIEGIQWKCLNICQMDGIPDKSIDVAFDKATLDAMIHGSPWSPPPGVVERTGAYMREVFRVLKDDGIFLYVTYRPQHFIFPRFNIEGLNWDIEVVVLGGETGLPYHGFMARKKST